MTFAAVFSSSLGVGLTFGFQPPLIALVLSRSGYSSAAIGAVTAASLVAVILLGPLYPALIARLGLRRSVIAGIGCGAAILLLMPLAVERSFLVLLEIFHRMHPRPLLDRK